jgi:lysophospholipase L1-like esterase
MAVLLPGMKCDWRTAFGIVGLMIGSPMADAASAAKAVTIVAFGDSITAAKRQAPEARWPELVRRSLVERFPDCALTVINAGVGGNTSREGLARIEKDVLAHSPDIVLIEFGNDGTRNPARNVPLEEFVSNLREIKTKIAERSRGRLILLTFPPIIDQWHVWSKDEFFKQNGGLDAYQERYRTLTRQFAREHELPLIDIDQALRQEMKRHDKSEFILPDGVHLTDRGNRVVADAVLEVLTPEVAKLVRAPSGDK